MIHNNLFLAKRKKDDEHYTRYEDIEIEVSSYRNYLKGKVVNCNCDDAESNFLRYFTQNFHYLKLKKLYCTGINGYCIEYNGKQSIRYRIDGDFRSDRSREILAKSDIVITNPPFSLFRQWLTVVGKKDFLVIGNKNAISYKELFPLIQCGKVKIGYTVPNFFYTPEGTLKDMSGLCRWFTTLPVADKSPKNSSVASQVEYEHFDLYPAINVDRVVDIPVDYEGLMGVPITFMDYMDYSNYEIVDLISRYAILDKSYSVKDHQLTEVNGKPKYARLIIKRKIRNNN